MTPALAPAPDTDTELMEQLTADIQRRWAAGEPPDAAAALSAHPELRPHKPLVLELAYEEFCLRAERGDAQEPRAFAARFPYPESVARLLAVHSIIGRQTLGSVGRPAVELKPGDTVGDWLVVRRLGRGGFADVYLVTNPHLGGRAAVLKVSTRGEQEAHTLGRLNHEHLMEVSDAPPVGGHRAMLSPFRGVATGETLVERAGGEPSAAWLLRVAGEQPPGDPAVAAREFPISGATPYPLAVLHIAAALARALEYLHGEGVSHRDLKPSNLLIGPNGYPYLLDFNLAGDGQSERVGGTIGYAAPEVLAVLAAKTSVNGEQRGDTTNWPAADVFSFAVLVFELLLLRHPYLVGDALDHIDGGTVARAAASAFAKLDKARLPLPKAVRRLLLDCLHPNPTTRPTAAQLAHGLSAALAPRPRRRVWLWVTASAVAVALGGVGVAWALRPDATPFVPETDPEPTDPFARGVWLVSRGEEAAAIPSFNKAAEADTTGRAYEWLGYCHGHVGNYRRAVECLVLAEKAGRKTVAVYANRAATRLSTSQIAAAADAIADANEALKIDKDCKAARTNRGVAYVALEGGKQLNPPTKPLPRWVVDDIEAGMRENESRGWVLELVAEAHLWVVNSTDVDRERAVWAANRSVRVGYPPTAFVQRKIFVTQLDAERLRAALLVTDDERLPQDMRTQLIMPDE